MCSAMALAQEPNLTVTITDILAKPTDKAFLCYPMGGTFKIDSVAMENGKFFISTSIPEIHQRAVLYIAPGNSDFYRNPNKTNGTTVYVEPGNIEVYMGNTLGEIKVGGTPLNDDFQAYYGSISPFKEREAEMEEEFQVARKAEDNATMERLQKEYQELAAQKRETEIAFFNSHLDSEVSLDWLSHSIDVSAERTLAEQMFGSLSERLRNSSRGQRYMAQMQAAPHAEVGDEAPDFTSKDVNGDEVSLSDFRGKYVLVDFWASWCGPCRRENPNVVKAYERFKSDKFEILGVSLDNQKGAWVNAIQKDGLTWPQVSDLMGWQSQIVAAYVVRAVPANFLVSPEGKIVAKDLRGEELERKLSEILK